MVAIQIENHILLYNVINRKYIGNYAILLFQALHVCLFTPKFYNQSVWIIKPGICLQTHTSTGVSSHQICP